MHCHPVVLVWFVWGVAPRHPPSRKICRPHFRKKQRNPTIERAHRGDESKECAHHTQASCEQYGYFKQTFHHYLEKNGLIDECTRFVQDKK